MKSKSPAVPPPMLASAKASAGAKKVSEIVNQFIAAPGSGIPGGWSVQFPWSGGIIKAEGGPEEIVNTIAKTLRANGENANTDEIAKWCLKHFWMQRAGPSRWKQKFEANGNGSKLQKPAQSEKLTPKEYGRAIWELANIVLAMPPKERPMATLQPWLELTTAIVSSESVGCDECQGHMEEFLAKMPFNPDWSDEQQRVWLWLFHDNASQNAKQHRQAYARVAKHWRWPTLTDAEFETIKKSL